MDLDIYHSEFMQEIYARSGAENDFNETIFTERMCDFLVDQALFEEYSYTGYKKTTKGLRVDAWDYNEDTEILTLLVTDFRFSNSLESLTKTDIQKNYRRAENFFRESLDPEFYQSLEESSPAYELARAIYENKSRISRVDFILLSNAQLSKRVADFEEKEAGPYRSTYNVWDISRICRLEMSGNEREDISVSFETIDEYGLPCLPAYSSNDDCRSYLFVMPGEFLAGLYDRYGERLLEQNVRTFLQFRGKVNKGIRNTIINEPEMFFAYNNGITATAEEIVTTKEDQRIKSVKNFQIVNGGQTTASIFTSKRKQGSDLSSVHVQVKLSIIPQTKVEEVVPKISEYANTQNKVSAADFFSNHPYHLRIEELSRRMWAPSPTGGLRETHWFYERARGQYANAQANLTPARKKEFLALNPRYQKFTKTDLAKFEHSVDMLPHIVSLGAQKNFAHFASKIGKMWDKNDERFNELYFKRLIAKAIIFRYLDKHLMKQDWYGGYKANIVTYTVAKFMHTVNSSGQSIDLEKIWNDQKLPPSFEKQLMKIAKVVNGKIQDPPEMFKNVTEWCKKELCWKEIRDIPCRLDRDVIKVLQDLDDKVDKEKDAQKQQGIDNGIACQEYVFNQGVAYWDSIRTFGLENRLVTPKEKGILDIACGMPGRIPTEKQAEVLLSLEEKLKGEGFYYKG